ncbi:hypothetical protein EDC56_3694 [Sinobacterium caligoides]|uniref:TRAP transporter TAXI family solute receptor n=1 Tax=Sinobacterium caligoides TaxID=933926 RepID=A0A3N2DE69_9GAMM|nr:TAXI family TRAP transporter solute-binding subunit [Sinobacterium caligoides]ROR98022.1 hypothetical protein EDC56_3694 [Sinobacterium caligoides]
MGIAKKFTLVTAAAAALSLTALAQAEDQFISIGTGGVTGVYFPVGGHICGMINRDRSKHGIRCSAESTGGSVANINTIRAGEMDFGIAQSDTQADAYNGTGPFKGKPYKGLRSVFSLHPEPIQILVRADAKINTLDDLVGKRVNIANPGSGSRMNADLIMKEKGWDKSTFRITAELRNSEQAQALCDGKFDATFWSAGLPNASTQEATSTCDVKILAIDGDFAADFIQKYPAYSKVTIPGGMFMGNEKDIMSVGPLGTLVTSDKVSDEVVYQLTKAVFSNFNRFRRLHPALNNLKAEDMATTSLVAPLHPGAVRYYKERKWIK